jgi:hypothetical protein
MGKWVNGLVVIDSCLEYFDIFLIQSYYICKALISKFLHFQINSFTPLPIYPFTHSPTNPFTYYINFHKSREFHQFMLRNATLKQIHCH